MAGHTESDFEAAIETHLLANGWQHGSPTDYDVVLGFDAVQLIESVQETQPKVWANLTQQHGAAVVPKVVKRIADEIDAHGVVQVLRRGVKERGQRIQLAFFRPTHGLTPELVENYATNRLLVYRQLHHNESSPHQSLDLMLAVNGIPVEQQKAVTAFLLGNPATHATVSADVDPAVLRAGNLPEHQLIDLRDALKAFTRAYALLGHVLNFTDDELESLDLYGKLLLAKLKEPTGGGSIDLGDTALEFIGHQAGTVTSGSNGLGESSGEIESFTGEGRGGTVEGALMVKLSELIDTFNAAHGIDLSQAETLQIHEVVTENETFADAVQKIISTETWKAARRKHEERAA